jgi:hypothetical protein
LAHPPLGSAVGGPKGTDTFYKPTVKEKDREVPGKFTFSLKGSFNRALWEPRQNPHCSSSSRGPLSRVSYEPSSFRTKSLEGLSEGLCLPIDPVNYVMYLEDLEDKRPCAKGLEKILKIQLMFECTL